MLRGFHIHSSPKPIELIIAGSIRDMLIVGKKMKSIELAFH